MQISTQSAQPQNVITGINFAQMAGPATVTPDLSFEELRTDAPIFHAIREIALTTPGEISEMAAWVEKNRQPHPRNEELPQHAPSVRSLIYDSKIAAALNERAA